MIKRTSLSFLTLAAMTLLPLGAEPVPTPVQKLLLPFFEVSLDGGDRVTLLSVVNPTELKVEARATVFTNWAIPVLEVDFTLGPKDVQSISLNDWVAAGQLVDGETVCADGSRDCMELVHLQKALIGEPSPMTTNFLASVMQPGVATGFVVIEARSVLGLAGEQIWGDYFYADLNNNYAQGQRLARMGPSGDCEDLCRRHAVRYMQGGAFSGGTRITIWNWDGVYGQESGESIPQFQGGEIEIEVYDEDGRMVDLVQYKSTLPVEDVSLATLGLTKPFGWLEITTSEPSAVAGFYRASGKFSVGVPSWCLPCDPCQAGSECFDSEAQCNQQRCIPARVMISGNRSGVVGQPFSLTYRASGSRDLRIDVSSLPAGLIHDGSRIAGTPLEEGTFTVRAENDCGSDELKVVIGKDDTPAKLTLIKQVINNDGGTAQVRDFRLFAGNREMTSGVSELVAPGTYTVREENLPGYIASGWGGDCTPDGRVNLKAGDHKTCVITNDDVGANPPKLTLIKHVINDDGGTARVSDFRLFAGNRQMTSGVAQAFDEGSYTVREDNLPGYAASSWGGDCTPDGRVTLGAGDHKTCVITNDDQAPKAKLKLVKYVINDDGGTARVSDFRLFAGNRRMTSGAAETFAPGTYTVREENLPGYVASAWGGDCSSDGRVTLKDGDHKTCTITNDDQAPKAKLKLVKYVINDDGGTARVSDFRLFAGNRQMTSGAAETFAPGTYTVREENLPGYVASAWGGDCSSDGRVTLEDGDHKTCTITNDDQAAKARLTLIKYVQNNDGGTAQVSDFNLFVGDRAMTSGVAASFDPGSYQAREVNLDGYTAGDWGGDCSDNGTVTLRDGDDKTCTITNFDQCDYFNPPTQSIRNGEVDYNDPHRHSHHTEVRFEYRINGAFDGQVRLRWVNGSSQFIKKKINVKKSCKDGLKKGTLFWESDGKSHHPGHGASYFAEFVVGGRVVHSQPLN